MFNSKNSETMRPNQKNSEQGKIEAFESHLDSIHWEGYAEQLKQDNREAYDWYYMEFAETHLQAANHENLQVKS